MDKLAGAFANGVVVTAAIHAGMTGNAKPSDITNAGLLQFKMYMFFIPMALLVISALIFMAKIKLTEAKHAEIVSELERKLD